MKTGERANHRSLGSCISRSWKRWARSTATTRSPTFVPTSPVCTRPCAAARVSRPRSGCERSTKRFNRIAGRSAATEKIMTTPGDVFAELWALAERELGAIIGDLPVIYTPKEDHRSGTALYTSGRKSDGRWAPYIELLRKQGSVPDPIDKPDLHTDPQ